MEWREHGLADWPIVFGIQGVGVEGFEVILELLPL